MVVRYLESAHRRHSREFATHCAWHSRLTDSLPANPRWPTEQEIYPSIGEIKREGGRLFFLAADPRKIPPGKRAFQGQYDFLYPTFAGSLQAGLRLGGGLYGTDPSPVSPLFEGFDHRSWLAAQA